MTEAQTKAVERLLAEAGLFRAIAWGNAETMAVAATLEAAAACVKALAYCAKRSTDDDAWASQLIDIQQKAERALAKIEEIR